MPLFKSMRGGIPFGERRAQDAFANGAYFAALASINSTRFIVPAIASTLGFAFESANSSNPQKKLFNYLQEKQILLVIDNLEHLLNKPGVEILSDLLTCAPKVKLLATAREALGLQGEWIFEVRGLPVPDDLQTEGFAREVDRGFDVLSTNTRDPPARHRSMRAAFDHSWKLLAEDAQNILLRLSVFRGGFTREASKQVAGANLSTLSSLVTKSLVRRSGDHRHDLHELIRQYAYEQLANQSKVYKVSFVVIWDNRKRQTQSCARALKNPKNAPIVYMQNWNHIYHRNRLKQFEHKHKSKCSTSLLEKF